MVFGLKKRENIIKKRPWRSSPNRIEKAGIHQSDTELGILIHFDTGFKYKTCIS